MHASLTSSNMGILNTTLNCLRRALLPLLLLLHDAVEKDQRLASDNMQYVFVTTLEATLLNGSCWMQ